MLSHTKNKQKSFQMILPHTNGGSHFLSMYTIRDRSCRLPCRNVFLSVSGSPKDPVVSIPCPAHPGDIVISLSRCTGMIDKSPQED